MRAIARVCLVVACTLVSTAASAESPVEFDSKRIFSCSEVKPPQQADSAKKVILVVIPISANFNAEERTVEMLRYELMFPKSITVLDHLPKTQRRTNVVGAQQEQTREHHLTDLNVKFGGNGRASFSAWGVDMQIGGDAVRNKRDFDDVETHVKVDRLPPLTQVITAGTKNEGQTLYFNLNWFDQTTRAGLTDYAFLAEVPKDWTGDVVTLSCAAKQNGEVVGRLIRVVGLFLSGDNSARQRIEKQLETAQPSIAVEERKDLITNSIGTKMKLIPAGSFLMGATPEDADAEKNEKPQRRITITKSYYLGVYEVTQSEYRQIMGENPSHFKDSELLPVENLTWLDAIEFCNKLSEREKRKPYYKLHSGLSGFPSILGGNGYRLPTEAEWEYGCRAPTQSDAAFIHPFGNDVSDLANYAWFKKNSGSKTHPVGTKKANRWGLYDMQGNVWEWCQDFYSEGYYHESKDTDPSGALFDPFKVGRGGAWDVDPILCRPADRNGRGPGNKVDDLGFRLAADQE